MPLVIEIKNGQGIYIGGTRMTASHKGGYTVLLFDGVDLPIMKVADTIALEVADTPVKLVYHHLHQAYLERSEEHFALAESFAQTLTEAEKAVYDEALPFVKGDKPFIGLKKMRRLAGV